MVIPVPQFALKCPYSTHMCILLWKTMLPNRVFQNSFLKYHFLGSSPSVGTRQRRVSVTALSAGMSAECFFAFFPECSIFAECFCWLDQAKCMFAEWFWLRRVLNLLPLGEDNICRVVLDSPSVFGFFSAQVLFAGWHRNFALGDAKTTRRRLIFQQCYMCGRCRSPITI